jgi:phosphate transport system substrate-binding protein
MRPPHTIRWRVPRLLPSLAAAFALLLLGACGQRQAGPGGDLLTLAGSTSVQPFAEKLAENYMDGHPGEAIDVQGGGSSAGIMAVTGGASQIGMSSRELHEDEARRVKEFVIAADGIALVVHPDSPLSNLTLDQVRAIYAGWVTNWRQLGVPLDHEIDAISREEGSGTRGAFEEMVMKKAAISDGCLVQDSNGSVRELVSTDRYAIGYISVGLVNESVRELAVDGVRPTVANIKSHRYTLVRPFLFLTRGEPQGRAKGFLDFVLGRAGQSLLEHEGLVGVGPS